MIPLGGGARDATGAFAWAVPVPADPSLEGITARFQAAGLFAGGAYLGSFNLTNGLEVRVGTATSECP